MVRRSFFVAFAIASALGVVVACSTKSSSSKGAPANDSGVATSLDGARGADAGGAADGATTNPGDDSGGATGEDTGEDAAVEGPHAYVRVVDLARPKLLDLDFCFSTDTLGASATWVGPMMAGTDQHIENNSVSPYVHAPVGSQAIRFVLADSNDCVETVDGIPDFSLSKPLVQDAHSTIIFAGVGYDAGGRGLQVIQLDDAVVAADAGNSVRVINVAPNDPAIDVYAFSGYGLKTPCTSMFENIQYGEVGTTDAVPGDGGPTASNGYTPLRGKNLYNFTFGMIAYVDHSATCTSDFGNVYSTNANLGQGAWTLFIGNDPGSLFCRDDGADKSYCINQ